jgi:transcriptional regulator with XRE-family HTH domain
VSSSLFIAQKNLAANVRAARKAMNISQEELAFRAGIDRTYASQIERAVANPSLGIISALGDVLGQSSDELLRAPELFS